jgi:glycosyltransferase involved in cell wall biosynthesis/GNAT superfamily N-acetyltransferase
MERMLRNIIRGLNGRNIHSTIALLSDEEDLLDFGGLAEIHRIRTRPKDPRPALELVRFIKKTRPTVLHARNFSIWPEAALAHALTKTPLVVSYHGADPGVPPLSKRVLVRGLVEITDHVFAVSAAAKALIVEQYGLPGERIDVIPNGVDTHRFSPSKGTVDRKDSRVVIGNVGRLFAVKNLALLLRAGGELKARGLDFEIVIAGDGPDKDALKALARSLGIADRVRLLGRTEDIPNLLRSFDVFALTSDLEGHPNALLEAMATGLPCVATQVASVPEALDGGRAGILIRPNDQKDLADAIERLATDASLRKKLGDEARARVIEAYGEEKTLDDYASLYTRASGGSVPPPVPKNGEPRKAPVPHRERIRYRIVIAEPRHRFTVLKHLKKYVIPTDTIGRFRWLYRDNPQGRAVTWLALEPERGEVVGFTSIFARAFTVDGEPVMGGVGLDAFVRPDHRRRGIAAALHAASLESMRKREVPFRMMCGPPVQANYNALLKIGSRSVGQMRYLHLPLTVPGLLRALNFPGVAERIESAEPIGRVVERAWKAVLASKRRLEARIVERVTPEFDRLWRTEAPIRGVIGVRDGAFVAWRYLANPMCRQDVVAIEDRGRLLGWAVLELSQRGALIVDNVFPADPDDASLVLRRLLAFVLELRAPTIAVFTHDGSVANEVFTRNGFLRGRSPSDFQVMCGDEALLDRVILPSKWFMRAGDLDPESCHWSVPSHRAPWTDPNYVATEAEVKGQRAER